MRRWTLVLPLVLAACVSRGMSRHQLYDRYVDDLTTSGVPQEVALCVIEHLFDPMSNAQLKAFNTKGDALTAEQMDQVRRLAAECASGS